MSGNEKQGNCKFVKLLCDNCIPLLLVAILAGSAPAKADGFTDLGVLTGGTASNANGVSADGSVVVGDANVASTYYHAFKYTGTTMTDLGTLGGNSSFAMGASGDGSVIAGYSNIAAGNTHAFKYTGATMYDLGTLGGGTFSYAFGISTDGSVIVGYSDTASTYSHAFKYTGGTMYDLGTLGGNNSFAQGVSADGSVIVGESNTAGGYTHAFKCAAGTMYDLGTIGSVSGNSQANAVSGDGSVIVGDSFTGSDTHAFKYTGGTMYDLGTFAGGSFSTARGVSADGTVIVGQSDNGSAAHAFKYTGTTMSDLGVLTGGTNSYASGVSADGSVIVGQGDVTGGSQHAFIYRTSMVDVDYTYTTLAQNGSQLNAIVNLKTTMLTENLTADCNSFGAHGVCLSVGGSRYSGNESDNATQTAANLKAAYRISDKLHAGVLMDWGFNTSNPNNFSVTKNPLFGAFAVWGGELGAKVKVSAAFNKATATITRTVLNNTESGQGNTNINTTGTQAEAAYGLKVTNKATASPYIGIRRTVVEREAYIENSGASFPISYNAVGQKQTTVFGGLRGTAVLASAFGVDAAFGGEYDINNTVDGYTGTINTLGDFNLDAPAVNKARLLGSLGAYCNINATQKLTAGVSMAKETLQNATGTTISAGYTLAF